jgi:hypothetical protein
MNRTGGGRKMFITRDSAASWVSVCVLSTFSAPSQAPVLGRTIYNCGHWGLQKWQTYVFLSSAFSVIYMEEWHFIIADVFLKRNNDNFFLPKWTHYIETLSLLFLYFIFTHIQYIYYRLGPGKITTLCFLSCASWNLKRGKKHLWETTVTWNWADLSIIREFAILQLRRKSIKKISVLVN